MTTTSAPTLTNDSWTFLHSGGGDVLIQLRTVSSAVEIVVKAGAAPTGDGPHGVLLDEDMPSISMAQTGESDVVYGRAFDGGAIVAVMGG